MDPRHRLGEEGETQAADWLKERGWQILARRWRCKLGEIDLIALDGETMVFIEVKTRSSKRFGTPEDAILTAQRRRLVRAATAYLRYFGGVDRGARFDVVAIDALGLRHIRNAFPAY
jgi:putative endonuclease